MGELNMWNRGVLACGLGLLVMLGGCGPDLPNGDAPPEGAEEALDVDVVPQEAEQRVDVMVGGELFTSYIYSDTLTVLKKPVLYPIRTATGTAVTRGYPLEAKAGERADHPHHIGLWFNYGDVNGLDFWNNSDAVSAERASRMGTIYHREIKGTEDGQGRGALEVTMEWVTPQGEPLLREDTRFVFHAEPDLRAIDRITTLTALDQPVDLKDNKEGVLGLRVTRALEHLSDSPVTLTDASGKAAPTEVVDNEGVTGHYLSSEGIEGEEVWGTRGRWMILSGVVEGDSVAIVMMDHPQNVGYPTYWHARGYGLFAANPLGQAALSDGEEALNFALAPGESTTFQHRILILSGHPTRDQVESEYEAFTGTSM